MVTFEEWYKQSEFSDGQQCKWATEQAWNAAVASEREACAKICDEMGLGYQRKEIKLAAEAIRARSNKEK